MLVRHLIATALVTASWVLAAPAIADDKRVALVIGNAQYRHIEQVRSANNDARAIANALRAMGFDVTEGYDLDQSGMNEKIAAFSVQSRRAELAIVYYAGRAARSPTESYFGPVDADVSGIEITDANISAADEPRLAAQAIKLTDFVKRVRSQQGSTVFFIDACPPAKALDFGPRVFVSYANEFGHAALEGDGPNAIYTTALLRHLHKRGLELREVMRLVRTEVRERTSGRQSPRETDTLGEAKVFVFPEGPMVFADPRGM